jgi:hypothetical protein
METIVAFGLFILLLVLLSAIFVILLLFHARPIKNFGFIKSAKNAPESDPEFVTRTAATETAEIYLSSLGEDRRNCKVNDGDIFFIDRCWMINIVNNSIGMSVGTVSIHCITGEIKWCGISNFHSDHESFR